MERDRLAREKEERHDRAIAWYKAGRLDSADRLFKTVLKENPSPEAWFHAGRANLDKGRWKRALKYFDKSPPDMRDIDRFRGQAFLKIGKKKEALAALERHYAKVRDPKVLGEICAIKKEIEPGAGRLACLEKLAVVRPSDVKLHQELAVLYRMAGEKGKSLEREALTVALEPSHGEANYRLGLDWSSQGVHDRAVPHLEHAVTAFPARGDAWKALAKGQAALGRKEDAVRSFAKAAALMPDDLDVARGRLALARESSGGKELEEACRGVLRIAPADPEAALGLARLRYRAGDYAAAESHFRIGLGDSRDAIAWGEFGRSLIETRKPDAAAALRKALDLGDTSRALRIDLARLHMAKGEADKAETLTKEMSTREPADPEPYYWLARIAGLRQQAAVQEELLRKANQLAPSEGRYAESLGIALRDRDEFAQAAAVLRNAEAGLGQSGLVLLADCLARSGQGESALAIYDSLFRKEPGPFLLARRLDARVALGRADEAVDAARGSAFADRVDVRFSLAKAHMALAESHVIRGDLDQAVSLMKDVLRTDRHRPEFHYHLGRAWFLQKRYKKSAGAFTDAMRFRMDYPEAVYGKGLCLLELGRAGESRNFFGELSQHADPRWKARGLGGLARVFEAEGKWEAVEHHLIRSVGAMPHADAMAELSRVNLTLGRVQEAEEWAAKALELDSSHVAGNLALADALASRRKLPEALDLTETALRAKPLSCRLLVQTAKLNLEAGNLDSTLAASGKAIQACPQDPQAHFYAGMASRGANRPADAKRHFKSYRKLGGDRSKIPD
jgi:tetratricopeptide (TPR) repeat protein